VVPPETTGHHRQNRPALRRRRVAAVAGALAAVIAVGVGLFALSGDEETDPGFTRAPGTSARHLTARTSTMPLTDAQILELLLRRPDVGPLRDPQACLNSLDQPAGTPILGAAPVTLGTRPAVLLVLPAVAPSAVLAVVVAPDCPTAGTGVLARTELSRP
jgi:hypothetical protein